jgi:ATP-dependent exoDNAse (exonuclease V) beta subunit
MNELITFESLRKLSLMQHWFKLFIDSTYDMVMIDETQDFDIMMLRMLLDDTTIPKIFVGDPKQSIYEWRGCINGFNYMPSTALIVEFYSTFRVGDPACERIRQQFRDCWMISKSINSTILSTDITLLDGLNYTYLFRTWRNLLKHAQTTQDIWIHGYDEQLRKIRNKHRLLHSGFEFDNDEYDDDLPKFLKSLSGNELEELILNIENNIVNKDDAKYKLYTVHSYKGLEADNIRISNDVSKDDENLYYVALTRGMKHIIQDTIVQPIIQHVVRQTAVPSLTLWDFQVRRG